MTSSTKEHTCNLRKSENYSPISLEASSKCHVWVVVISILQFSIIIDSTIHHKKRCAINKPPLNLQVKESICWRRVSLHCFQNQNFIRHKMCSSYPPQIWAVAVFIRFATPKSPDSPMKVYESAIPFNQLPYPVFGVLIFYGNTTPRRSLIFVVGWSTTPHPSTSFPSPCITTSHHLQQPNKSSAVTCLGWPRKTAAVAVSDSKINERCAPQRGKKIQSRPFDLREPSGKPVSTIHFPFKTCIKYTRSSSCYCRHRRVSLSQSRSLLQCWSGGGGSPSSLTGRNCSMPGSVQFSPTNLINKCIQLKVHAFG